MTRLLGGVGSLLGSQRTVNSRKVSEHEARGRLIAALDLLDRHWVSGV